MLQLLRTSFPSLHTGASAQDPTGDFRLPGPVGYKLSEWNGLLRIAAQCWTMHETLEH